MSFLDSIKNQSKKHQHPFDHWEYNNALSDGAIDEIMKDGPFTRRVIKPIANPKTVAIMPAKTAV